MSDAVTVTGLRHFCICSRPRLHQPTLKRRAGSQPRYSSVGVVKTAIKHITEFLVIPDLFLRGSAPLLRSLQSECVLFPLPVLWNLLKSPDLVQIRIWKIPEGGSISPEDVAACLSRLTRLEEFELGFRFPFPWPSLRLASSARCALPALTSLRFTGPSGYLEHLIAPIDSPLLDNLNVVHFHFFQPGSNTPQLAQFVDRTPKLKVLREAHTIFGYSDVFVALPWTRGRGGLHFRITFVSGQLFGFAAVLYHVLFRTLIPMIKRLYILNGNTPSLHWLRNIESSQWLDLLCPFTAVEDLYLSQEFSLHIVPALHGISGEGMKEVLPFLQNLFLERPSPSGPVEEAIEQSVTALNLASRPIAISQWDRHCDQTRLYNIINIVTLNGGQ
ncbi:hypothetical protein BGY98DRAFT_1181635 [Russula aff. rugulosa BPL654]|nr:hypothetical protein BGY98DRAFT_1181635 [Russula aff. rugulosa BPL654]